MTAPPLVAVLGATGAVGGALARMLAENGGMSLRLGSRTPASDPSRGLATRAVPSRPGGGRVELVSVDATDAAALARFCRGCQVVVNCAGPLAVDRSSVAAAVRGAGSHYVDPGGDEVQLRQVAGLFAPDRRGHGVAAILGAGVMPGLSGLIPRWLASDPLLRPVGLTLYVSTLDRMTPATAVEFLLSLVDGYGEANAAWRNGRRVSHGSQPRHDVHLPFFLGPVTAYPYLSAETDRLARALSLREVDCYHVFAPGSHVLETLGRLSLGLSRGSGAAMLAAELTRAAQVDLFGRPPHQQIVAEIAGLLDGRPAHRAAVLRATGTYELTATVTALAVAALCGGAVRAGAHLAAEVLDPELVPRLPDRPGVLGLHLLDRELSGYATLEHGTI